MKAGMITKKDFGNLRPVLKPDSYGLFGKKYAPRRYNKNNVAFWIIVSVLGVIAAALITLLLLMNRSPKEPVPVQNPESVVSEENDAPEILPGENPSGVQNELDEEKSGNKSPDIIGEEASQNTGEEESSKPTTTIPANVQESPTCRCSLTPEQL